MRPAVGVAAAVGPHWSFWGATGESEAEPLAGAEPSGDRWEHSDREEWLQL